MHPVFVYLGRKRFSGLSWSNRERLLHIMRDAGVLWLQLTGGEPLIATTGLLRRRGSFRKFERGLAAAVEAKLPVKLNIVVARHNEHEVAAMEAMAEQRRSICKVGRDPAVDLMVEGIEGLPRLTGIADSLHTRSGGCAGCKLSGTCWTCRPLAKLYQQAEAPLGAYCQHGGR